MLFFEGCGWNVEMRRREGEGVRGARDEGDRGALASMTFEGRRGGFNDGDRFERRNDMRTYPDIMLSSSPSSCHFIIVYSFPHSQTTFPSHVVTSLSSRV